MALIHPRLLSTLVLIDPVIHDSVAYKDSGNRPGHASTFRRDIWPSRADAAASCQKKKFYQSWDPRVFDRWVTYGFRDLPTKIHTDSSALHEPRRDPKSNTDEPSSVPVTLATTKHQEVFTFLRPNFHGQGTDGKPVVNRENAPDIDLASGDIYPFYRPEIPQTFQNLPFLRPSVLYLFGGKSPLSNPEWCKMKMNRTGIGPGGSGGAAEGRVKQVVFEDVGHLIPMEAVTDTGNVSAEWIARETERWQEGEEAWRQKWEAKPEIERSTISDEWKRHISAESRTEGSEKL